MNDPSNPCENRSEFYIYPRKPQKIIFDNGRIPLFRNIAPADERFYVAVKYLWLNDGPVFNNYLFKKSRLKALNYYTKLNSDGKIDQSSVFKNSNGYLIVPANFELDEVLPFAKEIKKLYEGGHFWKLKKFMQATFAEGGKLDLQRGISKGVPPNEFDPATVGSASFIYGVTSEVSGVPEKLSELFGGVYNLRHLNISNMALPYGMSRQDTENFEAGFAWAKAQMHDPNSAFYKQAKAFGLGVESQPKRSGSLAPRGRSVAPLNTKNGSNHASNDGGAAPFGQPANGGIYDAFSGAGGPAMFAMLDLMPTLYGRGAASATAAFFPARSERAAAAEGTLASGVRWHSQVKSMSGMKSLAPHGAGLQRRFSQSASVDARYAMPGAAQTAPAGLTMQRATSSRSSFEVRRPFSAQTSSDVDDTVPQSLFTAFDNKYVSHDEIGSVIDDHLNRQARLPPSGYTGFDPWLSPAWPGRKLPN
jgi:hypothetical protein